MNRENEEFQNDKLKKIYWREDGSINNSLQFNGGFNNQKGPFQSSDHMWK